MLSKPLILVGSDLTPFSDTVIKAAETLRKKTNGDLMVLHVSPYPYEWNWLTDSLVVDVRPEEFELKIVNSIKSRLSKQIERCEIKAQHSVVFGRNITELQNAITTYKADILVLGHNGGHSGFHFLGGLTSKMISSTEIPVLVINGTLNPQRIAGLVDPEYPVKTIFPLGEELSFLFSSELQFISAHQDISTHLVRLAPIATLNQYGYSADERGKITSSIESRIKEKLDPHSKAKVNVEITQEDSISDYLLKKLQDEKIDLVVMTRHHHHALDQFFIGSITRRILERYKGNLFILPPS
jgi:nucleotide-binding universal stress UspA family protein